MSLYNVFWSGKGKEVDLVNGRGRETTIVEVILNTCNCNVLDLPIETEIKSAPDKLKAYAISAMVMADNAVVSLACFRTKVNEMLKKSDSLDLKGIAIIECYEDESGRYSLHRLDANVYMENQNIEVQGLPPELLLVF